MRRWLWCLALVACDDGDAGTPDMPVQDAAAVDAMPMDAALDQALPDQSVPPDLAVMPDQDPPVDAGPPDAAPPDMLVDAAPVDMAPDMAPMAGCIDTVQVGAFEMFRFEASRPDATAEDGGADGSGVCSQAGVLPWVNITLADARDACAAAGFTVCTGAQWQEACVGPNLWPYPYGESYAQGVCNDHVTGSGMLEVTGGREACVGPTGIHDQNGNVWELTDDGRRRGASYRINASMFRPEVGSCEASFVVPDDFFSRDLGFRCCRALPPPG